MRSPKWWEIAIAVFVGFLLAQLVSCAVPEDGSIQRLPSGLLAPAPAQPAEPARPEPMYVSGTIRIGGQGVEPGTMVIATCGQSPFAVGQTFVYPTRDGEASAYAIQIDADDPETSVVDGCVEGGLVAFAVGNTSARETINWQSGLQRELNLTGEPQPDWSASSKYSPRDA
jgi:hypothetical protein